MPPRATVPEGRVIPFPRDPGLSAPQYLRRCLESLARMELRSRAANEPCSDAAVLLGGHYDGSLTFTPAMRRKLERQVLLELLEETHLVERAAERATLERRAGRAPSPKPGAA